MIFLVPILSQILAKKIIKGSKPSKSTLFTTEERKEYSTLPKMQERLDEAEIPLKIEKLCSITKKEYLGLIFKSKPNGRKYNDDQIEVIKKCRHRCKLLIIKKGPRFIRFIDY